MSRFSFVHGQRAIGRNTVGFRPCLELLEDRVLPSTFLVTNLHDSGAGSLRAAVAAADSTSAAVINFAPSLHGTIGLTSGELDLTGNMTIAGPNPAKLTVSGSNLSRVFDVAPGVTATISGLTIANGSAMSTTDPTQQGGGGVLNEAGATLYLTNDVFASNRALVASGALENVGGPGVPATAIISHTTFIDNQAIGSASGTTNPYMVFDGFGPGNGTAEGGAIDDDGHMTLADSSFINNQALGVPGNDGVNASGHGGAIAVDGTATVTDTTFSGNRSLGATVPSDFGSAQGLGGGAVIFGNASFTNCNFTGNEAVGGAGSGGPANTAAFVGAGGGILALGGATLNVSGSLFSGNQAIGGAGGTGGGGGLAFGGGLNAHSGTALTLSHSLFHGNAAIGGAGGSGGSGGAGAGGAISVEIFSTAAISDVVLTGNQAVGGAGGTGAAGGSGYGGALAVGGRTIYDGSDGSAATISNSVIADNLALGGAGGTGGNGGGGYGGGVFLGATESGVTPSLAITDSVITANSADGGAAGKGGSRGAGIGGGVYDLGDLSDTDTVIAGNRASSSNNEVFA